MEKYEKRIIDDILVKKLIGVVAVLIEGPKWCGKTTTAEQVSNSVLYMAKPDEKRQNLSLLDLNPSLLLDGDAPRLIDEWQIAPKLWDAVRFEVDHRNLEGQFILTGSASPVNRDEITHTGTGRFSWLLMRPMSLFESGDSNGSVSLSDLFNDDFKVEGICSLTLDDVAYFVCRGGWPRSISMNKEVALEQAFNYYSSVVNSDIKDVDDINKDSQRVKNLMRSYARNIGTQASNETLKDDISNSDSFNLGIDTVISYVNALKRIFVIEEAIAWNPNLRSKTVIRSSNTRYFIDPSIATAALGIGPGNLVKDLNTFGFLFESLCIRDLRVYASSINGEVYHYKDASGLECDAVVHLRDGSYGLVEIKLGGDLQIDEAAINLKQLYGKLDTSKMNNPSFMMIITATGKYAYKREDGICIVPIGCLKN